MQPQTWAPFAVTGLLSASVTVAAPRFFGPTVTPMTAYLTQGAVAVGGGLALPALGLAKTHGFVWFIVGTSVILADMVGRYLMQMIGLAAYPYEQMSQLPYYPPQLYGNGGMAAYPYETVEGLGQAYDYVPTAPFD